MSEKNLADDFTVKIEKLQSYMNGYDVTLETKEKPKKLMTMLYTIGAVIPILFFLILIIFKPKYWTKGKEERRNVKKMFWSAFLLGVVIWVGIAIYYFVV